MSRGVGGKGWEGEGSSFLIEVQTCGGEGSIGGEPSNLVSHGRTSGVQPRLAGVLFQKVPPSKIMFSCCVLIERY